MRRADGSCVSTEVDVAIVGAGPGGVAAALASSALGLRVALFDPRLGASHAGTIKPCGEGLMPAGADTLLRLGIATEELGRPFDGVRYVAPDAPPLDLDFCAQGIAIHRGALQGAMDLALSTAPSVAIFPELASVQRTALGTFEVRGERVCVRSLALIAADGAGGRTEPCLSGIPRKDRRGRRPGRLGMRVHCEPAEPLDRVEVHFGADCEVYLTPLAPSAAFPKGLVNVVLLFDHLPEGVRGGANALAYALGQHPRAACHIGATVGPIEARALDHGTPRDVALENAFFVGDAAGSVDPVLGCGTTVALRTGVAAAYGVKALRNGVYGPDVMTAYRHIHKRETAARRRVASALQLVAKRPALARGAVRLARALPGPTARLVALAARIEPLGAGTCLGRSIGATFGA